MPARSGVATLSDPRLDYLAALHKPKKVTPASVEFLDTPGLLAGSHADNPQRLALIREGDALLIVLNGFAGGRPGGPAGRVSRRNALRRSGGRHQLAPSGWKPASRSHGPTASKSRRSSRSSRPCRRPSKKARRSPRSDSRPRTRSPCDRSAC